MKIRPIDQHILVKRDEADSTSKGGIIIPDQAQIKPQRGVVAAVGEGAIMDNGKLRSVPVSKGDKIIFKSYAGTEITVDGEKFLIVDSSDVLAVIE